MPGHFTLHAVEGEVLEGNEWKSPDEASVSEGDFSDLIEAVKVVYGVFFDSRGNGDVWLEIVLGHNGSIQNPIRIDSFYLGSNNEGIDPKLAGTDFPRNASQENYLWDEAESLANVAVQTPSSDELMGRPGAWKSMYEQYDEIDGEKLNRIFACNVGNERILCTPVRYDSPKPMNGTDPVNDSDIASLWKYENFRKLSDDESPVLYPPKNIEKKVAERGEKVDQDTITFWTKWHDANITIPNDDISFHFRFAYHSDIGEIKHNYPYYVLPQRASLMESLSEDDVDEFYPKQTHWMFLEWSQNYDVDRAGTGRMTRSKVKGEDYVFNSGVFGFSVRSPKNMALRFFYAVLGGGILANIVLTPRSYWQQIISVLGIIVLVYLVYLTFVPRETPIIRSITFIERQLGQFARKIRERIDGKYE